MRLTKNFFTRDVLEVAPELLGKVLVRKRLIDFAVREERGIITEVEAYRGEEDWACHARFGKTKRTEVMYGPAGHAYVYLIYGLYWMLNIVTGPVYSPQAVLIRGVKLITPGVDIKGPGRVGEWLKIDKSYYGEDVALSERLWVEAANVSGTIIQTQRIGVDYAGEWAKKPWRYLMTWRSGNQEG